MRQLLIEALDLIRAQKEWIMAVPQDLKLPTMPGLDRDLADDLEGKLQSAIDAPEKLSEFQRSNLTPISRNYSDIPVEGMLILDKNLREWANENGLHVFYSGQHWHVMQGKKWLTTGYETPQKALEACREIGVTQ